MYICYAPRPPLPRRGEPSPSCRRRTLLHRVCNNNNNKKKKKKHNTIIITSIIIAISINISMISICHNTDNMNDINDIIDDNGSSDNANDNDDDNKHTSPMGPRLKRARVILSHMLCVWWLQEVHALLGRAEYVTKSLVLGFLNTEQNSIGPLHLCLCLCLCLCVCVSACACMRIHTWTYHSMRVYN